MSNDKFEDQRIYDAGYRAGWNGSPKNDEHFPDPHNPDKTMTIRGNPYRGSEGEKEFRWDYGYENGQSDKKKNDAGEPLGQPITE